nr:DNA-3-methyladenine glycosylase [Longispora albida]
MAELPEGDLTTVAKALLGWEFSAHGSTVRLTEVEAYAGVGADPASHAHRGPTPRNQIMFGPPGYLYVYFVYGMHWCANVVLGGEGEASALLLRAGEVVGGIDLARERRPGVRDHDLARGPARLCTALALGREANGAYLLGDGPIRLRPPAEPADPARIATGPRVGVAVGSETPWRFWLTGEPSVSVYKRHKKAPAS